MRHLTNDELTELYYGEGSRAASEHIQGCADCRAGLRRTEDLLRSILQYPVPEPEPGFEGRVWGQLVPRLPAKKQSGLASLFRPWILAPTIVALLAVAITIFTVQRAAQTTGIPPQARARMLLISLGDHLDRSQILLAELVNADPGRRVLADQRENARDLADENRLLREASNRNGDASRGALLEDLEGVLLTIANAPADTSPEDLAALQRRIDDEDLLFKVRVTGSDLRREEQKL